MKNHNRVLITKYQTITGILVLTILCACSGAKRSLKIIDPDKFIFIEYIQTNEGKQLTGKAPQGPRIDGPAYHFDSEKMELRVNRKPSFSIDSTKIILGSGKVLRGVAGSGVSVNLNEVETLPYTMGKLKIRKINKTGVYISHDGKSVFIKNGADWQDTMSYTDTLTEPQPAVVEFKTTYTIRNWGLISKKSITF